MQKLDRNKYNKHYPEYLDASYVQIRYHRTVTTMSHLILYKRSSLCWWLRDAQTTNAIDGPNITHHFPWYHL